MKKIWNLGLILLISILAGTALLWGVFCLPIVPMQNHMGEVIKEFVEEGENPFLLQEYKGSSLDNSTDALMLGNAVFASELPAYKASMLVQHSENAERQHLEALQKYLMDDKADILGSYSRYWHGYLILLKPLLLFFNYFQIRILNGIVTCILFLLVLRKMYKRNLKKGMVAFGFAVASLFPMAIPWSLQFSSVYYVGILACLGVLYHYEILVKKNFWIYFFCIIGICTSFVDFLTYPVFTFGMPLITYIAIRNPKGKEGLKFALKTGICWCVGYLGMWAGKWTVGSVITGGNVWRDAIGIVGTRISSSVYEESVNRFMAVLRNFYIYFNVLGIIFTGILLLWVGIHLWKYRKQIDRSQIVLFVGIACIPVVWYIVTANHSYIHYWYTFRALSVSVFTIGMMPQILVNNRRG